MAHHQLKYDPSTALHVGDRSKRVTVPLPPTLAELTEVALTRCGMKPPLTLYWNGQVVTTVSNFGRIKDNDVIVLVDDAGRSLDMMSMYRADYLNHPLPERRSARPPRQVADTGPFSGMSEYDAKYIKHPLSPRQPKAAPEYAPSSAGPFSGVSENTAAYVQHPITPRAAAARSGWPQNPLTESRDFSTESRAEYLAPEAGTLAAILAARKNGPSVEAPPPTPRFNATSEYRNHFTAPPPSPPRRVVRASAPALTHPFEGESEYDARYQKWPIGPATPKPRLDPPPSTGKFVGRTLAQDSYVKHDAQRVVRTSPGRAAVVNPETRTFETANGAYAALPLSAYARPPPKQTFVHLEPEAQ